MFFYTTGEEVRTGDLVRFHLEPGTIGFVVDPSETDRERQWYAKEFGGGVMILEPKHFGSVFLPRASFEEHDSHWEDLEFVSRAEVS